MHGPEGETDMETTVALIEKVRRKLAADLAAAMQPAGHVIRVMPAL